MTKPLPFTKASIRRAIAGAEAAGKIVLEVKPDGTLVLGDASQGPSSAANGNVHLDPYVIAAGRVGHGKTSRKRNGRAS